MPIFQKVKSMGDEYWANTYYQKETNIWNMQTVQHYWHKSKYI
jgi:hypothetical protein